VRAFSSIGLTPSDRVLDRYHRFADRDGAFLRR